MDPLPRPALRLIAERFKLLSNPTRLEILQHICGEERSVNALVDLTGFKQANVSKQLGLLDRAGLVRRRADGNHVYYCVADESLPKLCELIARDLEQRHREFLSTLGSEEEAPRGRPHPEVDAPAKGKRRPPSR